MHIAQKSAPAHTGDEPLRNAERAAPYSLRTGVAGRTVHPQMTRFQRSLEHRIAISIDLHVHNPL